MTQNNDDSSVIGGRDPEGGQPYPANVAAAKTAAEVTDDPGE